MDAWGHLMKVLVSPELIIWAHIVRVTTIRAGSLKKCETMRAAFLVVIFISFDKEYTKVSR